MYFLHEADESARGACHGLLNKHVFRRPVFVVLWVACFPSIVVGYLVGGRAFGSENRAVLPSDPIQPRLAREYSLLLVWGGGLVETRVVQCCRSPNEASGGAEMAAGTKL